MSFKYTSRTVTSLKILVNISERSHLLDYHEHDFLELAYVLDGKAEHFVNDTSFIISKGDYFIVDYGVKHKYKKLNENGKLKIMNCLFSPQLIDETLKNCRRFEDVTNHYLINFNMRNLETNPTKFLYQDTDGEILKVLKRMLAEYEKKDMGYQEILRGQLIELLIRTMRKIQLPDSESIDNSIVQHVIKHVQKHYAEKLSLEQITQKYNFSLSHTSYIFKKETGFSFQEYVQTIRIKESCRLLINTSKLISEISYSVGYSDTKFFNEIFKRQLGLTPRQYRKLYQSKETKKDYADA